MSSATTPIEASLLWAISKVRRADGERAGNFPGAERVFAQQQQGVARKRVGLLPQERVPVREGAEIVDADGKVIGQVCSGGFGPTLGAPVAMGYVDASHVAIDSDVWAVVRGKRYYRVSAAGFARSEAASMCGKVKARGQGCFAWAEGRPMPGAVDIGRRMARR